jgi:hypothetical protein
MHSKFSLKLTAIAIPSLSLIPAIPLSSTATELPNKLYISQNETDDTCEAYARAFASAKTKRYYIEICGSKDGKFLSLFAVKQNDPNAERDKIQIDFT